MKKLCRSILCGFVSMAVVALVVNIQETWGADKIQISIGAGTPGAVLYPLGVGISTVINKDNPQYNAIPEQTGGARENINLLINKKLEIGLSTDNFALEKYDGKSFFYGWTMYDTDLEFVVLRKSKIFSIKDLKGKKVSLGPPGSASNVLATTVLKAYGIEQKDFSAQFLGWEKQTDAMTDGLLDAAVFLGIWPVSSIQALAMKEPIRILDVDPAVIKKNFSSAFHPLVIHADAYTDKNVNALGMYSSVWIRGDLGEDVVYHIAKSVFTNIDAISKIHPAGKQFRMLKKNEVEALGVNVHPGVLKYAKEKGLWN
jgi:TRAP transporter TAXI family solute receptor